MFNLKKLKCFIASGIFMVVTVSVAASQTDTAVTNINPQELLRVADSIRNPDGTFSVKVALQEYRNRRLMATSSLIVFSRPAHNSGQYNNLLRFLTPARDADKLMLRNGKDLWFYDPASKVSIRISPQARLIGQASNGDVMSVNLAQDYDATLVAIEAITDGSGNVRNAAHLFLSAQRSDVTYPKVDYWVDPKSGEPVKAQFRTAENRILKRVFFRQFKLILGKSRPTEIVIVDGVNPNWVTVMRVSEYQKRDVPETWLHRAFLPRFLSVAQ